MKYAKSSYSLMLPQILINRIDAIAAQEGISRSHVITRMLATCCGYDEKAFTKDMNKVIRLRKVDESIKALNNPEHQKLPISMEDLKAFPYRALFIYQILCMPKGSWSNRVSGVSVKLTAEEKEQVKIMKELYALKV